MLEEPESGLTVSSLRALMRAVRERSKGPEADPDPNNDTQSIHCLLGMGKLRFGFDL